MTFVKKYRNFGIGLGVFINNQKMPIEVLVNPISCNDCGWIGVEYDLIRGYTSDNDAFDGCPNPDCNAGDSCLMDIDLNNFPID